MEEPGQRPGPVARVLDPEALRSEPAGGPGREPEPPAGRVGGRAAGLRRVTEGHVHDREIAVAPHLLDGGGLRPAPGAAGRLLVQQRMEPPQLDAPVTHQHGGALPRVDLQRERGADGRVGRTGRGLGRGRLPSPDAPRGCLVGPLQYAGPVEGEGPAVHFRRGGRQLFVGLVVLAHQAVVAVLGKGLADPERRLVDIHEEVRSDEERQRGERGLEGAEAAGPLSGWPPACRRRAGSAARCPAPGNSTP